MKTETFNHDPTLLNEIRGKLVSKGHCAVDLGLLDDILIYVEQERMQAYADQQVNRVLDEAIKAVDGIVSKGGEVEALLDVYEILGSLKTKQP